MASIEDWSSSLQSDVEDVQDQESTPTDVEVPINLEPDPEDVNLQEDVDHQPDVDQVQENISADEWVTKEQDETPETSRESAATIDSEYDSKQFIMDNFMFSFTSLNEEGKRIPTPETDFCRICHQRSLPEPNLSICNCRGTMGLIHKSCLERWLAASDTNRCELCHFKFTIKRHPKYGILKAVKVWMQTEDCKSERLHIILDMIRFTVSLPVIFFINHLTAVLFEIFHFDDTETCDLFSFLKNVESHLNISSLKDSIIVIGRLITYFSVGFTSALDVFAIGWFFSRVEEHYQQWHKWYRTQCVIHVQLPEGLHEQLQNKST